MKWSKKVIAWAILSLILQAGVLFGLDNFVFKQSSDFKSKKMEVESDKTKGINAAIPKDSENVNISYGGKYLSYNKDGSLYMEDTKTGTNSKVETEKGGEILYYKWLSDRDRLIIAEKVTVDGEAKIQLITYNPKNSTETFVSNICTYQKDMEVKKITESTITGVYYIDVYKGGLKSNVYRIDINNDLKRVELQTNILGNMQVIPHEDRLIYEDDVNSKFFVTSPNKQLSFNSNKKLTLLGIDKEDVVYIGELNGDKISSITYGKVDENTSSWKTINLDAVVNKKDIYFSNKSEILVNDCLMGKVKNLTTGSEVEYDGTLIQIKEGFIATEDNNGKLSYKNLEQTDKNK